jgi:hypothetical protein
VQLPVPESSFVPPSLFELSAAASRRDDGDRRDEGRPPHRSSLHDRAERFTSSRVVERTKRRKSRAACVLHWDEGMSPNETPTWRPSPMNGPIRDQDISPRIPRRRYPYVCAEVVCRNERDTRLER